MEKLTVSGTCNMNDETIGLQYAILQSVLRRAHKSQLASRACLMHA